jgi:5'-3' exonuclease
MITPGTKFMYDIDLNVSKWITSDNPIFPPQKVYSSYKSETHGEGEHKIFEYLKKYYGNNGQFTKLESTETKYHIIHGLDADLILLALLSDVEGIILMRHDYGNYVMIDRLRNHILRDLVVDSNSNVNPKILISDFCCMMAMIGNDFLKPHMMCEKMENAIPMLVEAYHKLGKQFTDLEGKINFDILNDYFKILVDKEKGLILDHLRDAMNLIVKYRSFPAEMTLAKIRKLVKIKGTLPSDEKESKEEAEKVEDYIKKNQTKVYELFRTEYNTNVVVPYSYTAFNKLEIADIKDVIDVTNTKSKTRNFCFRYLEGIQWNIIYYLYGQNKTRNNWGFNYHYSPLMIDIVEYMKTSRSLKKLDMDKIKVSEQKWHGLVSQALCVIPKTKSDILPKSLQKYYSEEQLGLLDQFPFSYKIDYFNFENNIHSRVLINFPDIDLIIDTVEAAPIKTNTAIYSLTTDYESRVSNLVLAIENRIKNIAMERQKESFTKKFTYRQKEEGEVDVSRKFSSMDNVSRGSVSRGRGSLSRGRGSVSRGRGSVRGSRGRGN